MSSQSKKQILASFFIGVISTILICIIFFQNQALKQPKEQTIHPIFENTNSISYFDQGIRCASARDLAEQTQAICLDNKNMPVITLAYAENKHDLVLAHTNGTQLTVPAFWTTEMDLPICEIQSVREKGVSGMIRCYIGSNYLPESIEKTWGFLFEDTSELKILSECTVRPKASVGEKPVIVTSEQICKQYTWPQ